jgi:hypothetical protein
MAGFNGRNNGGIQTLQHGRTGGVRRDGTLGSGAVERFSNYEPVARPKFGIALNLRYLRFGGR